MLTCWASHKERCDQKKKKEGRLKIMLGEHNGVHYPKASGRQHTIDWIKQCALTTVLINSTDLWLSFRRWKINCR